MGVCKSLNLYITFSTVQRADYKFIILFPHRLLVPLPGVSLLLTITGLVTTLGWMLRKLNIAKKIPKIDCVIVLTGQFMF